MKMRRRAETPQLTHWNHLRRHVCGDGGDTPAKSLKSLETDAETETETSPYKDTPCCAPYRPRSFDRRRPSQQTTWPVVRDELIELKARAPPHCLSHEALCRTRNVGAEAAFSKSG